MKATNKFEKDFYKLTNNPVCGKNVENIRNRVYIRLMSGREKCHKLVALSSFMKKTVFSEKLSTTHINKTSTKFSNPISVHMSILDQSKP
jgi:hypothetical protein